MKKHILSLALALMMGLSLSACSTKDAAPTDASSVSSEAQAASEQESTLSESSSSSESKTNAGATVRLGGLKGPTTIGLVKLLDDAKNADTANSYEFTMGTMPDEIAPKLLSGELDIIAAPLNMGSVLYNKSNGKIRMLAINTLGVLYVGAKGNEDIKSIADLKGKTIFATGKGATPEYVISKLLSANGIDVSNDVTIEWMSEPTEVLAAVKNNENAVAVLPQPFMTAAETQVEGFKSVLDLTAEWDKLGDAGRLVTAGFFTTDDYLENNKEAVNAFLEDYQKSAAWVTDTKNAEEAGKLVEEHDIVKAPIAQKAIPFCNIVSISGTDMRSATEGYLSVLNEFDPASIGGKLPEENFYYVKPTE